MADRIKKKESVNVSRTRSEKSHAQKAYTIANRKVKSSIMVHKQNFTNTLAAEAKAALHGNMRAIYNTTKIFQKKFGKS